MRRSLRFGTAAGPRSGDHESAGGLTREQTGLSAYGLWPKPTYDAIHRRVDGHAQVGLALGVMPQIGAPHHIHETLGRADPNALAERLTNPG